MAILKPDLLAAIAVAIAPFALHAQQFAGARTAMTLSLDQQRKSFNAQRASLKRQFSESGLSTALGTGLESRSRPPLESTFTCPPLPPEQRENLIFEAADEQSVDPDLIRAVMHRESAFRPCAVSSKGALGLMQLMPATLAQFRVTDAFDPVQSVHAGAALIRTLLDKYRGDLRLALAAYNAGPARVENLEPDTYPIETKNYIDAILSELGVASEPE